MDKIQKKGQTGGLITGLVFGIASLIIAVIIALVITSTLNDAGLLDDSRATITVTNESSYINATTDTLAGVSAVRYVSGSITVTQAKNLSDNTVIPTGNYTVSSDGVVTNATTVNYASAGFTYTYTQKTLEEVTSDSLSTNLTSGIDNVSSKIPTVLLVAAIVLILGVMVLLIGVWQKMRIGGGGI